jgi:glutamate racemase
MSEDLKSYSIAIFDSGFGGLTVMRHIRTLLPKENIHYFGDTARLPYGNKSPETIFNYCVENVSFLIQQKIKILVIACHTACTTALQRLKQHYPIPIIGVMEQGIEEVVRATRSQKIGIAGTRTTIASRVYQKHIQDLLPTAEIHAVACPLFVPIVEEGLSDHAIASLMIHDYFSPLRTAGIDTLLLGCTHYPLLHTLMRKELGDEVILIDPAIGCAEKTRQLLTEADLLNEGKEPPQEIFYVSDDPEKFRLLGKTFLNNPIDTISCVPIFN